MFLYSTILLTSLVVISENFVFFPADSIQDILLLNTKYTEVFGNYYQYGIPLYNLDITYEGFEIDNRYAPGRIFQIPLLSIKSFSGNRELTFRNMDNKGLMLNYKTSDYHIERFNRVLDKNQPDLYNWNREALNNVSFLCGIPFHKNGDIIFSGEIFKTNGFHPYTDENKLNLFGLVGLPLGPLDMKVIGIYNSSKYHQYIAQWKYNLSGLPDYEGKNIFFGIDLRKTFGNLALNLQYNFQQEYEHLNIFEDGSYDRNGDGQIDSLDRNGVDDFSDSDNDFDVEIDTFPERGFEWDDIVLYPNIRSYDVYGFCIDGYWQAPWATKSVNIHRLIMGSELHTSFNNPGIKLGIEEYNVLDYTVNTEDVPYYEYYKGKPKLFSILFYNVSHSGIFSFGIKIKREFFLTDSTSETFSELLGISPSIAPFENVTFYGDFSYISEFPCMKYMWPLEGKYLTPYGIHPNPALGYLSKKQFTLGVEWEVFGLDLGIEGIYTSGEGFPATSIEWITMLTYITTYIDSIDYNYKGIHLSAEFSKKFSIINPEIDLNYTYGICKYPAIVSDWVTGDTTIIRQTQGSKRHNLNLFLSMLSNQGYIPSINVLFKYQSGIPHYYRGRDGKYKSVFSADNIYLDLTLRESFNILTKDVEFYFEVRNLINWNNVLYFADIYEYLNFDDPDGKYNDPTVYNPHRVIRTGIMLRL
ncbi:hypothetical protein KAW48_11460 [candidate division WOR-3 bacterium]|nr:hypothetical protein [candidate division WOR-3 bacterium]